MTTSTTLISTPYLREQRQFPFKDIKELSSQSEQAYRDVARSVNQRTIGIFGINFPVVTGESWYLAGGNQKQQTLRQLYTFSSAGNIAHGVDTTKISGFTKIYGTFSDGTNWYPLPYVDVVAANNQVNVIVTPMEIQITAGAGTPPIITSGFVVLEWLSLF